MNNRLNAKINILVALAFFLPAVSMTQIRQAKDPAVEEYLKAYDDRVKAEKKAERKARRADPHRKLRPYLTLDEIYAMMEEAAAARPEMVSVTDYGKSVDGRPLKVMKISAGPGDKPSILYSANIHGNEMAGNMICMALIDYFIEGYGNDRDVTYLLDRVDVFVVPVLNPDGMARTVRQQDRYGNVFTITRKNTHKVDLNRNYPFPAEAIDRLKDSAGSNRKWMTNYRGPEPMSEPETRAVDALFDKHRFTVHCNFHTTGGIILSPPATLPEPQPDDELHNRMRLAYQEKMFDPYVEHTELQFYPTIGSLDDYIYHRYGTICITMEVGKEPLKRMLMAFHNGAYSPLFWTSNVYYIEREVANNLPAAVDLARWALRIEEEGLLKWAPSPELWVNEPSHE
jgi:murein tripeptide amidase MpaA